MEFPCCMMLFVKGFAFVYCHWPGQWTERAVENTSRPWSVVWGLRSLHWKTWPNVFGSELQLLWTRAKAGFSHFCTSQHRWLTAAHTLVKCIQLLFFCAYHSVWSGTSRHNRLEISPLPDFVPFIFQCLVLFPYLAVSAASTNLSIWAIRSHQWITAVTQAALSNSYYGLQKIVLSFANSCFHVLRLLLQCFSSSFSMLFVYHVSVCVGTWRRKWQRVGERVRYVRAPRGHVNKDSPIHSLPLFATSMRSTLLSLVDNRSIQIIASYSGVFVSPYPPLCFAPIPSAFSNSFLSCFLPPSFQFSSLLPPALLPCLAPSRQSCFEPLGHRSTQCQEKKKDKEEGGRHGAG